MKKSESQGVESSPPFSDAWATVEEWAAAYIRVHDEHASLDESHPAFSAAYEFMCDLSGPDAERCWRGVLAVVHARPSTEVLGMVAASLMEDLLEQAGERFITRIEEEACQDPLFHRMLQGIWESGTPEVWDRLLVAREVQSPNDFTPSVDRATEALRDMHDSTIKDKP